MSAPDPGGTRYFFVHLQKTAGTALFRRLRHAFGTDAVYPLPDEQGRPEVVLGVDHLQARLAELGPQIRVITGHFPLATTELIPGPLATFTVLREPVERVLSFLRHQREVEPHFSGADLEEIYRDPVSTGGLVTDHMVKMLAMTSDEMTNGALSPLTVTDLHVERAFANLTDRIDVMGLQEHFEVFCTDLETAFGWDLGPPLFMNRTRPAPAAESLREQIAHDNRHDVELYRLARDLWEQRHPSPTS